MTLVEKVARAIYEGRNGVGCRAWGHLTQAHRDPYLSDAKAALEAMREGIREAALSERTP